MRRWIIGTKNNNCGNDEIGRLPVLRSPGLNERVGSSPTSRTIL